MGTCCRYYVRSFARSSRHWTHTLSLLFFFLSLFFFFWKKKTLLLSNQLFQNIRAYRSHPFLFHRGARDKTFSCIPQSNELSSLRAPPTLKHQNPHFSFFFSFPRAYMLPAIMLIYTYFILNNNNSNKSNCGRQKGEGWATGKDDQVQSQNQNFIIVKGEHTIVHLLLLFCLRSYTECASTP